MGRDKTDLASPTLPQELATGKTADAAYFLAGYKENRSNAPRLGADPTSYVSKSSKSLI